MSDGQSTICPYRRTLRIVGAILCILALIPFIIFIIPQVVGADYSYTVLSSSMAPTYQPGDIVIVTDVAPSTIREGDVITFEPPAGHGMESVDRVTHRVVDVIETGDTRSFRTKGDAVAVPDQKPVPAGNVVGRVTFSIPALGHIILFANSDIGIITLVIVPSVLLIGTELWSLLKAEASPETKPQTRANTHDALNNK